MSSDRSQCTGRLKKEISDKHNGTAAIKKIGDDKDIPFRLALYLPECNELHMLERVAMLAHCGRVTQICVFNTVKLGTSASSP